MSVSPIFVLVLLTWFQIGEPRMDTGMIVPEDNEPEFDPTIPLLPEEVCWIIDRSFACEVIAYGELPCRHRTKSYFLYDFRPNGI